MIDKNAVQEILDTYRKYDWTLRRVLLTEPLKAALDTDLERLFGRVPVIAADTDALWFSRTPKSGPNAWEIRHLSSSPYALVEHIDESDADFEKHLAEVESRLKTAVRRGA